MSAPAWMPFYIADYLADTGHLSTVEHGAYLLLIMHYWQNGGLPADDLKLSRITRLPLKEWLSIRDTIADLFGDDWHHKRIDKELANARRNYERRLLYLKSVDARRLPPLEWSKTRARIFERDDFTCRYCGTRGGDLECDHIIPIARGGSNDDDNLCTACFPCNRDKGAKLLSEWRQ